METTDFNRLLWLHKTACHTLYSISFREEHPTSSSQKVFFTNSQLSSIFLTYHSAGKPLHKICNLPGTLSLRYIFVITSCNVYIRYDFVGRNFIVKLVLSMYCNPEGILIPYMHLIYCYNISITCTIR